jgi:tRNA(fMet)-specific endonuclease VapC
VKYLVDTNALSALMRGDRRAIERLARISKGSVALPQPVLAEIAYGLERLPRSKRKDRLTARYDLLRGELIRAAWTDEVSSRFGEIKATLERHGERIEDFDAAIAAHALAIDAVLVTANVGHMARVPGLRVEDWAGDG